MLLLGAYPRYALLWSSLPLCSELLCPNWTYPRSSSPTSLQHSLCVFYFCLYPLSSILSLTFLTHPTHSYLLLPHLIFCNSESAYSFYIYLPYMIIIRVCLCVGPALNISDWGLLLYPLSLDINLDSFTCLPYSNPASPGCNSYCT